VWAWYAPDPQGLAWLRQIAADLGTPVSEVEPEAGNARGRLAATG